MPASVIITVVILSIVLMSLGVLAVTWPPILDPRDRPHADTEQDDLR